MEKKTKGRQKVEMVKIAKESSLHVTFTKRRSGLFNAASELATLCGVEIGIIVFSPGGKVFSFGHPSVQMVVDRYLNHNPPQTSPTTLLVKAHRNAAVRELNNQLTQAMNNVEMGMKRAEELDEIEKENMRKFWWHRPVAELDFSRVQQLKEAALRLKSNVEQQKYTLLTQPLDHAQQFFGPSSSSTQPALHVDLNNNEVFNPRMASCAPHFPDSGLFGSGSSQPFFSVDPNNNQVFNLDMACAPHFPNNGLFDSSSNQPFLSVDPKNNEGFNPNMAWAPHFPNDEFFCSSSSSGQPSLPVDPNNNEVLNQDLAWAPHFPNDEFFGSSSSLGQPSLTVDSNNNEGFNPNMAWAPHFPNDEFFSSSSSSGQPSLPVNPNNNEVLNQDLACPPHFPNDGFGGFNL